MKTRNLLFSGVLGVPRVPNTEKASNGAACSDGTPNSENENTNAQEHQRCSKCLTDEEHAELKYYGFITPKAEHPRLPLAWRPVLAVPYLVKAISSAKFIHGKKGGGIFEYRLRKVITLREEYRWTISEVLSLREGMEHFKNSLPVAQHSYSRRLVILSEGFLPAMASVLLYWRGDNYLYFKKFFGEKLYSKIPGIYSMLLGCMNPYKVTSEEAVETIETELAPYFLMLTETFAERLLEEAKTEKRERARQSLAVKARQSSSGKKSAEVRRKDLESRNEKIAEACRRFYLEGESQSGALKRLYEQPFYKDVWHEQGRLGKNQIRNILKEQGLFPKPAVDTL